MRTIIAPVKGTRDFYPEQMAVRTWLYETARRVSESFGYQEWDAPFLESLSLYAAKSGEELVKEQSYVFNDRGGELITLRPELTPSLARLIAQKQNELVFPVRWWSWGPFWRYERPQRGRSREFFQWNVDMLGANSPESDAEMVAVLATFFRNVGLLPKDVLILVNNRRLMDAKFDEFGLQKDQRSFVSTWIDRRTKMEPGAWEKFGKEKGLSESQISLIKTMLDNKDLWQGWDELVRFFGAIDALGVSDYVSFDPSIMRGLLYYTGTVFEAWEVGGEIKRSINGGGRYDNLLRDVGGDPLSGTGFAMGDVVITLLLEKYGLIPTNLNACPAPVLVTVFSEDLLIDSIKLASNLRANGIDVICYPEAAKLPKQFKYADRLGMSAVLVLGPDEVSTGRVTVKNLTSGTQDTVSKDKVLEALERILESH
jgi:histidyl-tRNA synthetase